MRVVTYNTRGSLGIDDLRSTPRLVETVRRLSADILCFQEIHQRLPWSRREDQPASLSAGLSRTVAFQANLRFGAGGYGIAIASRARLVNVREHRLPSFTEQRGALQVTAVTAMSGRNITVMCTHWGLDAEERQQQSAALAEILREVQRPLLLCGDLNEEPDGPAVQALLSGTGLRDAGAGSTALTFPSDRPASRIDYILYSDDVAVERFEVIRSLASDHLPVLSDLALLR